MNVIGERLFAESGGMVFSGPFSTMKLAPNLSLGGEPPFIVGSYEQEIHGVLNDVIAAAPSRVVVIGAAFGYYAVGFALKIHDTQVIAFEAVEQNHWAELAELARLNSVSGKIVQKGLCTLGDLQEVCIEGAFVFSDCEGAEQDLLVPDQIPALRSCTLLVELHEFHRPDLVATLVQRFAGTHSIQFIEEMPRTPG